MCSQILTYVFLHIVTLLSGYCETVVWTVEILVWGYCETVVWPVEILVWGYCKTSVDCGDPGVGIL